MTHNHIYPVQNSHEVLTHVQVLTLIPFHIFQKSPQLNSSLLKCGNIGW